MKSAWNRPTSRDRRADVTEPLRPAATALGALASLLVLLGVAASTFGQNTTPPPPSESEPLRQADVAPAEPISSDAMEIERLGAHIAELEQIAEPADAQKSELTQLRSAVTTLRQAVETEAQTAQFEELMRTASDRLSQINDELKQIEADLARPIEQVVPAPEVTLEELTARLESARTQLEAARKFKSEVDAEFARRDERRAQIPGEIAAYRQQLETLESSLAAGPDPADPPALAQARRTNLLAQKRALDANLNRLDQEARSYEARRSLITARLERARGRVTVAERPFTALQKLVDARRSAAAEDIRRQAEAARRNAANAHQVVKDIIDLNAQWANELATVSSNTRDRNAGRSQINDLFTKWDAAFKAVQQQVEQVGLIDVVGFRLRNQRDQLPDLKERRRKLDECRDEMRRAQSRRFELEDTTIGDPAEEAARLLRESDEPIADEEQADILEAARVGLARQKELLRDLKQVYELYLDPTLVELHQAEKQLVELVADYIDFIDERVLWIKSASPLQPDDVMRTWEGIVWLTAPGNWSKVGQALWRDLESNPIPLPTGVVIFIALLSLGRMARRRLLHIAPQVSKVTTDRYSLTVRAFVLTIILLMAWPFLFGWLAWRLSLAPSALTFAGAVSVGFAQAAGLLVFTESVRHLCRPQGLAESHLRWRSTYLRLVRRNLRWFVPLVVPLLFITGVTSGGAASAHYNSLGRLAYIAALAAVALFIQRLFRPSHGILSGIIASRQGGWLDRLRYVWYPAMVLAPLVLAVIAGLGYFYTAAQLDARVMSTAWFLLLVFVFHALLLRWLYVIQRRLAFEQALKKRAVQEKDRAEIAEAAEAAGQAPLSEPAPPPEELEIDVAAVSAQSRRLLRTLSAAAIIIGLLVIYADVFPAFRILEDVELWSQTVTVTEPAADGRGGETVETVVESAVTLADLGLTLIILMFAVVLSQNLPGLLEITILQRLPFTAGARYATTTLVRYAIVIIGIVLAFNAIGIGWAKVQWLAAAITVGLGFGLQEIFANFVSGLIILFERPVRVGDTVTVGAVSGTVSRIRIRATTITDWDRKELIIPNREFVTGQIINWSLSDSILRITIPVGVAYGSDTQLAKELLLKVAHQHPNVLDDPNPRALFLGFGDSSLNLELRVFIPHIDCFIAVRDELHSAIDQAFRKAGIEISFPQRDIHIRSVQAEFPVDMRSGEVRD